MVTQLPPQSSTSFARRLADRLNDYRSRVARLVVRGYAMRGHDCRNDDCDVSGAYQGYYYLVVRDRPNVLHWRRGSF